MLTAGLQKKKLPGEWIRPSPSVELGTPSDVVFMSETLSPQRSAVGRSAGGDEAAGSAIMVWAVSAAGHSECRVSASSVVLRAAWIHAVEPTAAQGRWRQE